jgi:hypothetical protein
MSEGRVQTIQSGGYPAQAVSALLLTLSTDGPYSVDECENSSIACLATAAVATRKSNSHCFAVRRD